MSFRPSTSRVLFVLLFAAGESRAQNPASVTLTPTTSPSAGQPGVTSISVTGSNFPVGVINAADVSVNLQPAIPGSPTGTAPATAIVTVVGTTRRITFSIPSSVVVVSPTAYLVTVSGKTTSGTTFASANSAALTINPGATISAVTPSSGNVGQSVTLTITGSLTSFVAGSTKVSLGAGISVGGGPVGDFGPASVTSPTTAVVQIAISSAANPGFRNVTVQTGVQQATKTGGFTVSPLAPPSPQITDFNPKSAAPGALVTITGTNLSAGAGQGPSVVLTKQGGGTLAANVVSANTGSIAFVVPANVTTGPVAVSIGGAPVSSTDLLVITDDAVFSLSVNPGVASLIQGKSTAIAVKVTGVNEFSALAQLAMAGLPPGITASINPPNIAAGQTAVITLTAAPSQPTGSISATVTASALVNGLSLSQSSSAQILIQAPTTSLIGRTVSTDSQETPLGGVTITTLGKDGNGNSTNCTGRTVKSDVAGNFALTNLPLSCTGPQLIAFDGTTATSPGGSYAGVNLIFMLSSGQVTVSPVLVHLPRIDNVETFFVNQNASVDQTYSWASIPGLSATVYAGTTFTMPDGSKPNPFPLAAVQVPVDRLPDLKAQVPTMITAFIVAFQPANAFTNQPVPVYYPNPLQNPPGANMALLTLDPTHGQMVPYGTGTVSADGTQIVPDLDVDHPGHRYGLVHFDWHMPGYPTGQQANPGCRSPCPRESDPVDLATGLSVIYETDLAISSARGSLSFMRTFRNAINGVQAPLSSFAASTVPSGPFGYGTGGNFDANLGTGNAKLATVIPLVMPDGNQFAFSKQSDGTFINTTIPSMSGAVMTVIDAGTATIRWKDGTVWAFFLRSNANGSALYLDSVTDPNGNQIRYRRGHGTQIEDVIDQVGRDFHFNWNTGGHVTRITAPDGTFVSYDYNGNDGILLRHVTHPDGSTTSYDYDSAGNMTTITDGRGIVVASNTFDANGRVTQQVRGDGSVIRFSYVLQNPTAPIVSPVQQTTVTDGLGNKTVYRFSATGALLGVTDPLGETRNFGRDAADHITSITGTAVCESCSDPTSGDMTFEYDDRGNILSETDALGKKTTFTYDAVFNNVSSITDRVGSVTQMVYDTRGNLTAQKDANGNTTKYEYDKFGEVTAAIDATNQRTLFAYDQDGDLTSVTDPLLNATTFQYDINGRLTLTQDALGRRTAFKYDGNSRLTNQTNSQGETTALSYDGVGNLVSLVNKRPTNCAGGNLCGPTGGNNTTTFTYDELDRLLTRVDPLNRTDRRRYDQAGNLIEFQDRRGQTSRFTYDVANRLTGESYEDGSSVARSYDARDRLAVVADSASGTFGFAYDVVGWLTSSTTPTGIVQYTRDGLGRAMTRQVAGQSAVSYTYDPAGNLARASMPQASATFAYDPRDLISNITRLNGVSTALVYDQSARLLSLTHSQGPNVIDKESYGYDPVGNRTTHSTTIGQPLATETVATTAYDSDNEQIQFGTASNSFDANGNLISTRDSGGTTTFNWDSRNRLISIITSAGQTTTLTYDFEGNLLIQADTGTTANVIKAFVLDDLTNVVYEITSDGTYYSVLSGQGIDDHLAIVQSNGEVQYGLSDAVNSTVAAVNQGGVIQARYLYEPFGRTTASGSYPFQFNGRTPVAAGSYYYRARYYNPQFGRFLGEDPLGLEDGEINLFHYALGNPINNTDPDGQFAGVLTSPVLIYALAAGAAYYLSTPSGQRLLYDLGQEVDQTLAAFTSGVNRQLGGIQICLFNPHTTNPNPANLPKHERGEARRRRDQGGEKADERRRPPRKRPDGWKGPWPPKSTQD